jgi:hypothetical protein
MTKKNPMNSKRMILEWLLALALAWFALTLEDAQATAQAQSSQCREGLPALQDGGSKPQNQVKQPGTPDCSGSSRQPVAWKLLG